MNTKLARYIVSLLTCLFFCSQAYAQVPDLDDPSLNSSHGTNMEDPFEIEIQGDHFSYSKNDRYNAGGTSKLYLYYRMKIKKTMVINLNSSSNVPLQTFIMDEQGLILKVLYNGSIKDMVLAPGTYYIHQNTHDYNVYISLTVDGTSLYADDDDAPETPENYTLSKNMNYVRTITPTVGTDDANSLYYLSKTRHNIRYYDHLGRPIQEVAYKSSPNKKDVINFHTYDGLGRSSKQWLPVMRVTKESAGTFVPQETVARYANELYSDGAAFSYPVYEASPLNRVIENYGPGTVWQSKGHCEKNNYRTNTSADICLYLGVGGTSSVPLLLQKGQYPVSELTVVETKDEDGHTILTFTDRENHTILSRSVTAQETLDTYYVYNDLGSLCYVLPPMAVANLTSSPQSILDKYAYQYRYDYRQRCVSKKLPGCGWVEMVYDRNNRLVFTGDSEQQKRGECSFSIADQLGREVLNGVYQGALPDRNNCDASDIYAVFSPGVAGACEGYRINCPTGISLEKLKVLQANYYDRYTFASTLSGFGGGLGYVEDASVGKRYSGDPELHCKDLLTGRMTMVLGGNQKLYNTYYYDYDRNLIQERHTTLNGKIVVNKSSFNFSGQPVKAIEEYGTEISAQKSYSYDHMGRMIREVHTLGKDSTEFIYGYDLQDRIIRQTRIHGLDSLATDNRYNIRGWIEAIESPLFSQKLHYTDGSGTPCYNGNISSMTCKGNDKMTRGYKFTYDGVSRMTDATYGEGDLINANPNRFTEQVTGYDKNGNILGLKRYGQTGASSYGLIDNLSLTLNGNQLKVVNDAVTTSAYNNGFEFKDGAKVTTEYTYDTNGNLTKDLNKNIISIQYNMLNLPSIVSFSDGSTITYTYGADGTKLRIVHKIGSAITTTDYLGNVVYENGVAKLLLTGYGYVSLNDKKYHYYLQDHQGNNRVVVNSSGKVEETNHYYPFGGAFASTGNVQPYKYNGKELDAKKGLNWYDYGARMYDAALGRWHRVDPLAENYYRVSPYAYCMDNPGNAFDYQGKLVIFINGLHTGTEGASPTYWKMKNKPVNFNTAVMAHFGDWNARYYDGSLGGPLGFSMNMGSKSRYDVGYISGLRDAKKIISQLARDANGNITESIKVISHSMGGAYAKGFLQALVEYIKNHPRECNGISLSEYDFAPYQPYSQKAVEGVDTYQYSHKNDDWAGNTAIKGAQQMETSDDDKGHSITSFFDYINSLPPGNYKYVNGKFVRY